MAVLGLVQGGALELVQGGGLLLYLSPPPSTACDVSIEISTPTVGISTADPDVSILVQVPTVGITVEEVC